MPPTFHGFGLVELHGLSLFLMFSLLSGTFSAKECGDKQYHFFAGTTGTELQKSYISQILEAIIFVPVFKSFETQKVYILEQQKVFSNLVFSIVFRKVFQLFQCFFDIGAI
jgi:hypothetical protein